MTDFVSTRRRLPGGDLSPATALTLDRVRLGAGGPLVRLRVAGGRVTHVVAEEGTGGRVRPAGGERALDLDPGGDRGQPPAAVRAAARGVRTAPGLTQNAQAPKEQPAFDEPAMGVWGGATRTASGPIVSTVIP
ncbi:hypothetical protein [Streptomyces sp. GbtcB7]|uniref:hypothetical protein n=1 Tax=Streptomyces sp. GbtcB7 TaxID=2824752 RepID=UPI0020C5EDB5|nr:hypothetical protein [Streptomyces sp. GbtcB7]